MPPPPAILKHLIDVYFLNSHNQPYCFFHEATLRRQLLAGKVPHFLVLAIASSAVRYSMHEVYKNKQAAAIGAYTHASWTILLERYFASDNAPDIAMAQATALLATADFVGKLNSQLTSCSARTDVNKLDDIISAGSRSALLSALFKISSSMQSPRPPSLSCSGKRSGASSGRCTSWTNSSPVAEPDPFRS